tara:strand:+ start:632 stop:1249 length:618 start_codon:yes stop_codon:yes gene_type:complete
MECNKLYLNMIAFLALFISIKNINKLGITVFILSGAAGYLVTNDTNISIASACILCALYTMINLPNRDLVITTETFKSNKSKKKKSKSKKNKKKSMKENFEDTEDEISIENLEDQQADEEHNHDDDQEEFTLDKNGSFYENYKSLSKKQIKGLNKDTKNLINTQKQLIETLNNMGPALKDGKQIMDTFKNYFGSDTDINNAMHKF